MSTITQPRDALGKFGEMPHAEQAVDLAGGSALFDTIYSDIDRTERLAAMKADLADAVARIVDSGELAAWLDRMTANGLSRYSFNNRLLALIQGQQRRELHDPDGTRELPDSLMVMTPNQWKEQYGRTPIKGTKAMWILAPVTITVEEDDPTRPGQKRRRPIVKGFRPMAVMEASQTDGPPIPGDSIVSFADGAAPQEVIDHLSDKVAAFGFTLSEEEIEGAGKPLTTSQTLGYTTGTSKKVVLDSRLTGHQKASVLAHELGHVGCGHLDRLEEYRAHRGAMETEAEMTAYLVAREMGLPASDCEAFSAGYVAGWSKGDPQVIEKAFTRATRASIKILEGFGASKTTAA